MKRLYHVISGLAGGVLLLAGCEGDTIVLDADPVAPEATTLSVTSDNPLYSVQEGRGTLRFKTPGGEVVFSVETNAETWSIHQRQRGVARSGAERIRRYADAPRPAERGGVGTRRRGGRDGGRRVRRADVDGGGRAERGRNARNRGDAQLGADSGLRIAAERFDRNRLQL